MAVLHIQRTGCFPIESRSIRIAMSLLPIPGRSPRFSSVLPSPARVHHARSVQRKVSNTFHAAYFHDGSRMPFEGAYRTAAVIVIALPPLARLSKARRCPCLYAKRASQFADCPRVTRACLISLFTWMCAIDAAAMLAHVLFGAMLLAAVASRFSRSSAFTLRHYRPSPSSSCSSVVALIAFSSFSWDNASDVLHWPLSSSLSSLDTVVARLPSSSCVRRFTADAQHAASASFFRRLPDFIAFTPQLS